MTVEAAPRRTPFIDILQTAIGLGQKVGLVAPSQLEKGALMAHAAQETGLEDFGDPWLSLIHI